MVKRFTLVLICLINMSFACTSFGAITNDGAIIGKNRDYFYGMQYFELVHPLKQFDDWYANPYKHKNTFYALMNNNDVKFGINQFGLTAIEEDPPYAKDADGNRKYIQPYVGYSEGMILYGVLQNFATVKEIIPYINEIFSTAAPNYYQIGDKNSILTVEVAYGESNQDPKRKFTYKVLDKNGEYFTHTNYYLSPEFESLNTLQDNKYILIGAKNRLDKITQYVQKNKGDYSKSLNWYLDTSSDKSIPNNKNWCENTSIFRSDLQNLTQITPNIKTNSVYGTVSSFVVEYKKKQTLINLRIIDTINTLKNGNQKVNYSELSIPLTDLFAGSSLNYTAKSFIRKAPVNGVCN